MKSILPSEIEEGEERAAGFVLFKSSPQGRRYLLLHHRDGGHWAFPKGRLEPNESEMAAALREIFEETSIAELHPIPGFRETSSYQLERNGQPVKKTVAYFLAEAVEESVSLSSEHQAYRWLAHEEAKRLLTYKRSQDILDAADAALANAVDTGEPSAPHE